jgi:hypothetical protein
MAAKDKERYARELKEFEATGVLPESANKRKPTAAPVPKKAKTVSSMSEEMIVESD